MKLVVARYALFPTAKDEFPADDTVHARLKYWTAFFARSNLFFGHIHAVDRRTRRTKLLI